MFHRCSECGRRLEKTEGPIGPVCLKKTKPRNSRNRNKNISQKMLEKLDMFGEEINGSSKNDRTG